MASTRIYYISKCLAEILGTALLLFLGCMGCLTWNREYNHLQTNLTFGLVIMMVVQIFGCISGAHINPAVTVASVAMKLLNFKVKSCIQFTRLWCSANYASVRDAEHIFSIWKFQIAICYIISQFMGAYMGFGLLKYLTPVHILHPNNTINVDLCSTIPHSDLPIMHAFIIEYIATTVLVFICCAIWDPRNAPNQDSVPLKLGFAVAALGCVAVRTIIIHCSAYSFDMRITNNIVNNWMISFVGSVYRRQYESGPIICTGSLECQLWFILDLLCSSNRSWTYHWFDLSLCFLYGWSEWRRSHTGHQKIFVTQLSRCLNM